MLLALFVTLRLAHLRWNPSQSELILLALVLIMFARQSYALASGAPADAMLPPVYLLFNTLIVIATARIPFDARSFRASTKYGLAASVAIAIGALWLYGSHWSEGSSGIVRVAGSFNNPNQLGYFALCIASMAALFYFRGILSGIVCLGIWAVAANLAIASASKAAILSLLPGLIIGVAVIGRKRLTPLSIGLIVLFASAIILLYTVGSFDSLDVVQRLHAPVRRYDTVFARGWSVMPDSAMHLLFGAGALGQELDSDREIHVTYWSFMIDFGLFAFVLFCTVWFMWIRRVYAELGLLGLAVVAAPASVYGLSHNGSRFTVLWILIGFSFNTSWSRYRSRTAMHRYRDPAFRASEADRQKQNTGPTAA